MQPLGWEDLALLIAEQATEPARLTGVLIIILDHAIQPEQVRAVSSRARLQEMTQRGGVVGGNALVGVNRDDERGDQIGGRGDKALPIRLIVAASVAGPPRIAEQR